MYRNYVSLLLPCNRWPGHYIHFHEYWNESTRSQDDFTSFGRFYELSLVSVTRMFPKFDCLLWLRHQSDQQISCFSIWGLSSPFLTLWTLSWRPLARLLDCLTGAALALRHALGRSCPRNVGSAASASIPDYYAFWWSDESLSLGAPPLWRCLRGNVSEVPWSIVMWCLSFRRGQTLWGSQVSSARSESIFTTRPLTWKARECNVTYIVKRSWRMLKYCRRGLRKKKWREDSRTHDYEDDDETRMKSDCRHAEWITLSWEK